MDLSLIVTLLTKTNYLPGVVVLEYTLRSVGSAYPLIVMATPSLPQEARDILQRRNIRVVDIQSLRPPEGLHTLSAHDARFADTWTKLRAFEVTGYDRVVLMDADMIMMRNMDELMDLPLGKDEIAAAHVCACNPRKLTHYPVDWVPENCAYTPLSHPTAITAPTPITDESPRPHTQLNSGLVVLNPSAELAEAVYNHLYTSPLVPTWSFPDQDLLSDFFKGKWKPLPWCYNALKTLMIIHKPLWCDEEIQMSSLHLSRQALACQSVEGWRLELLGAEMEKDNSEDWKVVLAKRGTSVMPMFYT
ncbi:glycosyltransferase family 8 protein [Melanogaster broomeanus]|nr:glycosyltransferase family 8 protein [Melanogaster broomeanus]